jgi:hypothetical protein
MMMKRRQVLVHFSQGIGGIWAVLHSFSQAVSLEVHGPKSTKSDATITTQWGEDCSFTRDCQMRLKQAISDGLIGFDATESVRCPLCQEQVLISATYTARV